MVQCRHSCDKRAIHIGAAGFVSGSLSQTTKDVVLLASSRKDAALVVGSSSNIVPIGSSISNRCWRKVLPRARL